METANYCTSYPVGAKKPLPDKTTKKPRKPADPTVLPDKLPKADQEDYQNAFEERAAVLEFDAGLSREEAERQAADDLEIPAFLKRNGGAA